jgi:RNA polymerase sigma factor (sigma-70 family)
MTEAAASRVPFGGVLATFADPVTLSRPVRPARMAADEVLEELYRCHGIGLIRFALTLVGDRPTAEDVVQDAFAGLHRTVHQLSDPAKALAYLRVCVVNGCRSVHRSRRRAFGRSLEPDLPVWSAESEAMAREESRQTMRAVARLPRRAREVLAMRYYLDMQDCEIAAALGVSRGTVSSTASRALTRLARDLREAEL